MLLLGLILTKGVDTPLRKTIKAKFISKDIREFTSAELSELYPKYSIKLLVGCAPCQPFSAHTRKNKDRSSDERWSLLDDFGRLVEKVNPHLIAFENVPLIRKENIFTNFCNKLRSLYYYLHPELIVYCPDYGIPQKRRRLVLIASTWDKFELLPKNALQFSRGWIAPFPNRGRCNR